MANRRWLLTGLEFSALWDGRRESGMPDSFTRTCGIVDYREYLEAKRVAKHSARERLGGAFDGFLDVLSAPDIRVIVTGVGANYPRLRLQAVRRGTEAYLIEQVLADGTMYGGEFRVDDLHVLEIAEAVVDKLPTGVPIGRMGSIDLSSQVASSVEYDYRESLTREPVYNSMDEQAVGFLQSSVDFMGDIRIIQGISKYGSRHRAEYVVSWRDLSADGRYVITVQGGVLTARAVGYEQIVDVVNAGTARVVSAIREERC